MIIILKDLINIKNLEKLYKNLANIKPLILYSFFSYPSKRFTIYRDDLLRNSLLSFFIWITKQINFLKYYFFYKKKNKYSQLLIVINYPNNLKKKFSKKFVFFHLRNLKKLFLINLNRLNQN